VIAPFVYILNNVILESLYPYTYENELDIYFAFDDRWRDVHFATAGSQSLSSTAVSYKIFF
jgi:hypothetical protein